MVGWNLPNIILEGCLWGVIWPQAIGDMFGQNKKTQVLGLLTSVNTSTQVFSPVIGNLADKMSPRFSRLCGRRRPFVLTGHLTYCTGIVLCYNGLYDKKLELMIFGQLLMGFSGMLQGPNIMAWNAETIPAAQRNTNGAIAQTYMAMGQLAMNLLGILVGEGWVEHHLGVGREPFRGQDGDRTIWYMVMVWKFFMVPFMMMQFNSRAGCWWPEISKSKQEVRSESQLLATSADYRSKGGADYRKGTRSFVVRNEHSKWLRYNPSAGGSAYFCNDELNVCTLEPPPEGILGDASPEFSDFAQRFSADSLRSGGHGCMQRTRERARDFFSAFFDEPAFLWFYVVAVIGTISGNFMGPFFFYFLQDCFPSGYVLFGWRITKSNQTMISLLGMMGNIIVGLTSWTSKALSERFGARQMQIYSNGGPGTPFGGLVNQFEPFTYALFPGIFPLLFFWQIHDALMGGLGAAAGYVRTLPRTFFALADVAQAHLFTLRAQTLNLDILPLGPDGRPSSAARDMSVQATASIVPNMVMPAVLGWWLTKFSSHYVGFRYFYAIGGSIGLIANLLFCTNVHPLNEPLDRCCQCTRHRFAGRTEHDLRTRAKQRMGAATGGRADERAQAAQAEAEGAAQMYRGSYQRASYRGGDLSRPLLRSV